MRACLLFALLGLNAALVSQAVPAHGSPASPAPIGVTVPPGQTPIRFRLLLLIKPVSELTTRAGECRGRMTAGDIADVSRIFQGNFPRSVATLTQGRVEVETSVLVSNRPLTHVTAVGKGNYWPSPSDMAVELQDVTDPGDYDGVFVYWMNWDGAQKKSLPGGLGYSWPAQVTNGMGYSVVVYQNPSYWRGPGPHVVWLHEWCHQLEAFYPKLGIKLPRQGLHGTHLYPGQGARWYELFLNGDVVEPNGARTGLGENAWQTGTLRARYTPEYLTPGRRAANSLRNASFEEDSPDWVPETLRPVRLPPVRPLSGEVKAGSHAVMLQAAAPNAVALVQRAPVKPHTQYLVSGWVATHGVVKERKGRFGAGIWILGGGEHSRSLTGDQSWTYVTLVFNSGKRTQVDLAARLGTTRSLAVGQASFDDLCLIELDTVNHLTAAAID